MMLLVLFFLFPLVSSQELCGIDHSCWEISGQTNPDYAENCCSTDGYCNNQVEWCETYCLCDCWNISKPRCNKDEPIYCDGQYSLGNYGPPPGTVVVSGCTDKDVINETCVLDCADGYLYVSGSPERVCARNKTGPYPPSDLACVDIDECDENNPIVVCPSPTICRNSLSSFACDCPDGYRIWANNATNSSYYFQEVQIDAPGGSTQIGDEIVLSSNKSYSGPRFIFRLDLSLTLSLSSNALLTFDIKPNNIDLSKLRIAMNHEIGNENKYVLASNYSSNSNASWINMSIPISDFPVPKLQPVEILAFFYNGNLETNEGWFLNNLVFHDPYCFACSCPANTFCSDGTNECFAIPTVTLHSTSTSSPIKQSDNISIWFNVTYSKAGSKFEFEDFGWWMNVEPYMMPPLNQPTLNFSAYLLPSGPVTFFLNLTFRLWSTTANITLYINPVVPPYALPPPRIVSVNTHPFVIVPNFTTYDYWVESYTYNWTYKSSVGDQGNFYGQTLSWSDLLPKLSPGSRNVTIELVIDGSANSLRTTYLTIIGNDPNITMQSNALNGYIPLGDTLSIQATGMSQLVPASPDSALMYNWAIALTNGSVLVSNASSMNLVTDTSFSRTTNITVNVTDVWYSSIGWLEVKLNTPPENGTCVITQVTGTYQFTINCSGWQSYWFTNEELHCVVYTDQGAFSEDLSACPTVTLSTEQAVVVSICDVQNLCTNTTLSVDLVAPTNVPTISVTTNLKSGYINVGDVLRLQGQANSSKTPPTAQLAYKWSEENYNALTEQLYKDNLATPINSPSLALTINTSFPKTRQTYSFNLTVTDTPYSAWFSVPVSVNYPPENGSCSVQPPSGDALHTLFNFSCQNWVSPRGENPSHFVCVLKQKTTGTNVSISNQFPYPCAISQLLPPASAVVLSMSICDSLGACVLAPVGVVDVTIGLNNGTVNNNTKVIQNPPECVLSDITHSLSTNNTDLLGYIWVLVQLLTTVTPDQTYLTYTVECTDNATITGTLMELRQKLWTELVNVLNEVTKVEASHTEVAEQLSNILVRLVDALFTRNSTIDSGVVNTTQSIIQVILLQSSGNPVLIDQMAVVLSQMLEVVACPLIESVVALIQVLGAITVSDKLPSEAIGTLITSTLQSSNVRVYKNENFNFTTSDFQIHFSSEVLQSGNPDQDYVDILVTRYNSGLSRCRNSSGQQPGGDIVSINVGNGTKPKGLISFNLPLNKKPAPCVEQPHCSWWDENATIWRTEGCVAGVAFQSASGKWEIPCNCTHLTDFAALVLEASLCQVEKENGYYVFVALYVVIGAFAAYQFIRIVRVKERKYSTLPLQHCLIFAMCLLRAISSARYANPGGWHIPIGGVGVIVAAPYLITYWIYSLIVINWAALHHLNVGQLAKQNPLRWLFIGTNLVVITIILILFVSIVSSAFDDKKTIAVAGSMVMCCINVITGVAFIFYGASLARSLSRVSSSSNASKSENQVLAFFFRCFEVDMARRMVFLGGFLALCFFGESVMWILSAVTLSDTQSAADANTLYTCLFLSFDILAIVAVLYTFMRAIDTAVSRHKSLHSELERESHTSMAMERSHTPKSQSKRDLLTPKQARNDTVSDSSSATPVKATGEISRAETLDIEMTAPHLSPDPSMQAP